MTAKELERLHLLATLNTYGPATAGFIRERANDEAAHDAFDQLPDIEPRGIAGRLVGLLNDGLAKRTSGDGPAVVSWQITPAGSRALHDGLCELDGTVPFVITDEMVERATQALLPEQCVAILERPDAEDVCRRYARTALAAAFTTNEGPET